MEEQKHAIQHVSILHQLVIPLHFNISINHLGNFLHEISKQLIKKEYKRENII